LVDSAQGSNALGHFLGAKLSRKGQATAALSSAAVPQDAGVQVVRQSRSAVQAGREAKSSLSLADYLQKILTARVYDVAVETALERAPALSARLACNVLLKREDTQPVFSFKLRGAYNKMAHLSRAQLRRGVNLRVGWQPCPGRRAGGQPPEVQGDHRDAGEPRRR
jgi:hypothetical protein